MQAAAPHLLSAYPPYYKFRRFCELGGRALSEGDRTDERTVRRGRRDFGRAHMTNQTPTATADAADTNLRNDYDDTNAAEPPPGATPMESMGIMCPAKATQQRERGEASQQAGPPSMRMQRSRRRSLTRLKLQPPGATSADGTPAATAASEEARTTERAHAPVGMATSANERQQRSTDARPDPPRHCAGAVMGPPPGATQPAAEMAAESTAATEHADRRATAEGGVGSRGANASDPYIYGQFGGDNATPPWSSGSPPPGATCSSIGLSPPVRPSFLSPPPPFQPIVVPLILLAAVAATASSWERRHSGTSRPHRVSCCLWQLEDETQVHSDRWNERSHYAESSKCVAREIALWMPPEVHTNCHLHTPPPYDVTRLPVPYLWHSFATLIIEHRLPWLGHGLANTASPND